VRASRLVELLLLLQTRGRMTASELAAVLEVSVRTVHRDVEALAGAGVPVYAERGRTGGFRLLDGYRTRLTGFTPEEARALLLSGAPPRAAAGLGLGDVLAGTQLKLLAALPAPLREQAAAVRDRFHLDPSGWEHRPAEPPLLSTVVGAVWDRRRLHVMYRRWGPADVERLLDPLGLVLKVGNWYLVARAAPASGAQETAGRSAVRTYHVGRLQAVEVLDETFERPQGFDLAAAWEEGQAGYAERVYRHWVDVRISPRGLDLAGILGEYSAGRARELAGPPDGEGWVSTRIPLESMAQHAVHVLLRLGAEVEVVEPVDLRERVAAVAEALAGLYSERSGGRNGSPNPSGPTSEPSPAQAIPSRPADLTR
jgi:predicted DNA-binding transcriptional regulator YafY